ncbi:MAG: leucyl/phenylalanyl-tRNA--protein transferase [Campylobacteraceae bacterium]|jgi:leucyl/phenylalanyl-tRNA--protein transferase|nr:leucyl/phenylalanyl-tRNA--protein transferase [Campylobacteraceae bacterium]
MIYRLSADNLSFPDPREADENGVVAFGGDLSVKRLIAAYKNGIFPWPHERLPLLWFSPDPRAVLYPKEFSLTRSLRRSLKRYEIRVDTNFSKVIEMCASIRRNATWIDSEIKKAYCALHELKIAHSVESYDEEENLVGGLYGVCIGRVFCGESMFALKKDASKAALYRLSQLALQKGGIIDCQIINPHLSSLGAVEISREKFLQTLRVLGDNQAIL